MMAAAKYTLQRASCNQGRIFEIQRGFARTYGTIVRKKVKTYLIPCLGEEIENEGVKVLGHELE